MAGGDASSQPLEFWPVRGKAEVACKPASCFAFDEEPVATPIVIRPLTFKSLEITRVELQAEATQFVK